MLIGIFAVEKDIYNNLTIVYCLHNVIFQYILELDKLFAKKFFDTIYLTGWKIISNKTVYLLSSC